MKILFLLLLSLNLYSQVDSTIKENAYTSYYSFKNKAPLLVVYNLYKGGGDCNRSNFHFITGGLASSKSATSADYLYSGYDKGHLLDFESVSYDCVLGESTFRYYNSYPQRPELNRGIFKTQETDIRKISQTSHLIVFVGGFYGYKTIGNGVSVPDTCFKIVYSIEAKKVIVSTIFTNTNKPIRTDIDSKNLIKKIELRYNININKIIMKTKK